MSKIIIRKTYKNKVDYDKDKDYSLEMEKAKKAGDVALLAKLEKERNKKIDGESLSERKTYNYIDIGTEIQKAIREGQSPLYVKELTDARRDKAVQSEKYQPYKNDEIQKQGYKYYYDAENGVGEGYSLRPEEPDTYSSDIEELLSRLKNLEEFEYDPDSDEVFQEARKYYENEALRAQTDTLAAVQQAGGGASSYAVSAAAQAANAYRAALAEKIPDYAEIAYNRYAERLGLEQKNLEILNDLRENERAYYIDKLNQFNKDRASAKESYENTLDRQAEEDEAYKDAKEFEEEQKRKKTEAQRDLVTHYEKSGLSVPSEILELADMEPYGELNEKSADYYKQKIDADATLTNKKIQNYDARTSKTYKDMEKNSKKETDKLAGEEPDTTSVVSGINTTEDLKALRIENETTKNGVKIGNKVYSYDQLLFMVKTGTVSMKTNSDGSVVFYK